MIAVPASLLQRHSTWAQHVSENLLLLLISTTPRVPCLRCQRNAREAHCHLIIPHADTNAGVHHLLFALTLVANYILGDAHG